MKVRTVSPMARRKAPMGGGMGGGGSFLGTAAAAAAGVVGGSLLLGSIRSMMGGGHHSFGDAAGLGTDLSATAPSARHPGAINPAATLARDAGVNDIGSSAGPRRRQFACGIFRFGIEATITTTWISIRMISAATATVTTPDEFLPAQRKTAAQTGGRFSFQDHEADQMTMTRAPTLTRL
jgi:hypothetical protein